MGRKKDAKAGKKESGGTEEKGEDDLSERVWET
jgi:hypothetical protein